MNRNLTANLYFILVAFWLPGLVFAQHSGSTVIQVADSVSQIKLSRTDSLSYALSSGVDSVSIKFNSKIDSLNNLNLLPEKYTAKLDSLYKFFQRNDLGKLNQETDSLTIQAKQKLQKLDSVVTARSHFLDSLLQSNGMQRPEVLNAALGKVNTALPQLPYQTPTLPSVTKLTVGAPQLPGTNLPGIDGASIPGVDLGSTTEATNIVQQAGDITNAVTDLPGEAQKLKEGEYSEKIEETAEQQLSKVVDGDAIQSEIKSTEALEKQAEALKEMGDLEALKENSQNEFVDHFAGKEHIVQKDMEDIGKLQLKYRDIADSRFLPKRLPNEMKGKPFVERLIPGITIQVFQSQNVSVDMAPFVGYRFSGRITAGIGGYRRLTYFKKNDHLRTVDCYGLRLYNTVKVYKGINTYLELERFKPGVIQPLTYGKRTLEDGWNTKLNLGVYQRYGVGKRIHGHFVIMYDLVQIKQFPNSSGSSVRFGFDYQLKKKKKKN